MITEFGQRIRELRRKAGMSQEQLAEKFGVSVQAVSKWECSQSYPDIELMLDIAGTFGVTVDQLLNGNAPSETFPDDSVIRIVQYCGSRILREDEYKQGIAIPLVLENSDREIHVEIHGDAEIKGNISGNVNAGGSVTCDSVGGNVSTGMSVTCDTVGGHVSSGMNVTCDTVGGHVSAGMNVTCDTVGGSVSSGTDASCGSVGGDVTAGNDVKCEDVEGDITAERDIYCHDVKGNVYSKGNVECGKVEGSINN